MLTGDGVLGDHAFAGLDVAADEVGRRLAQGIGDRVGNSVRGVFDVDDDGAVGVDKPQGHLGIVLVGLHPVGQAHGDELCLNPFQS